jgi:adenine-specific DNA-methyltransferase
MNRHKLGQYFTTNLELKEVVKKFILNDPDVILEPSCGRGDLISHISNVIFDAYEIDDSIELLPEIRKDSVIIADFLSVDIKKKYKTIIGNPPYVKTSYGNLYIDFTTKCLDLLEEDGELIFIIPSDFFKLTSASELLNKMIEEGIFTHIYHPHKENLFEGASIDVLVYRYVKNKTLEKKYITMTKVYILLTPME